MIRKMMNNLTYEMVYSFLNKVDKLFQTPLSKKQDLKVLAHKLLTNGTICAETDNGRIVSIVAGYTENLIDNIAYISIVATLEEFSGKGSATKLIKEFINICREKKIDAVHLYTTTTNFLAIKMYKKIGFVEWTIDDEPRKDDLHLIYHIGEKEE